MKPAWIRVVGWVGFGSWYLAVYYLSYTDISKIPRDVSHGLLMMALLGTAASAAWVFFTIIWKFQQSQARAIAASMGRELVKVGARPATGKPLWIRIAGGTTTLVFWLSWLFLLSTIESPPRSDLRNWGSILGLAGLLGAALWAIATLAWKARRATWISEGALSGQSALATATPFAGSSATANQHPRSAPHLASGGQAPAEPTPRVYTYSAPGMAMCPQCGRGPTIFYCSTHTRALCLGCVAMHDNPGECVYLPAFRAPKPTAGSDTTSGPGEALKKPKPGDVFGIS
jgi:hypothetical protein